jgi:hypothetical protein
VKDRLLWLRTLALLLGWVLLFGATLWAIGAIYFDLPIVWPRTPLALVYGATPADYRVTGVETFIVGHSGIVYQKDLGSDTLKVFKSMERFNPDKTWRSTNDEWTSDDLSTEN